MFYYALDLKTGQLDAVKYPEGVQLYDYVIGHHPETGKFEVLKSRYDAVTGQKYNTLVDLLSCEREKQKANIK
jgi:hypothetical protein